MPHLPAATTATRPAVDVRRLPWIRKLAAEYGDRFAGVSEFFAMGGYAFFVWGSYGVTFALLALEVVLLAKRHKRASRKGT